MKKHLLPFILSFIPMLASAEAVAIEGIWYNLVLETNTAEVANTPYGYAYYTGSVVIPPKVTYAGSDYSVTSIGNLAFSACYDLPSVAIPGSMTTFGNYAFSACRSYVCTTYYQG